MRQSKSRVTLTKRERATEKSESFRGYINQNRGGQCMYELSILSILLNQRDFGVRRPSLNQRDFGVRRPL